MGIGTQGLGSFLEAGGGGGGGVTIIPAGGEVSGTYSGNVYCEGDAYLTGSVTVEGDLYIPDGTLYNYGGYDLTVEGSLYSDQIYFIPAVTVVAATVADPMVITCSANHGFPLGSSGYNIQVQDLVSGGNAYGSGTLTVLDVPAADQLTLAIDNTIGSTSASGWAQRNNTPEQGNFDIRGDLITNGMTFWQVANIPATVRVGGSLTGSAGFSGTLVDLRGLFDTQGAQLIVYGDLAVGFLDQSGGDSLAGSAGQGGNATVYGSAHLASDWMLNGGHCNVLNYSAGSGGNVLIYGDLSVQNDFESRGGDCSGGGFGDAGSGGNLTVYGDATMDDIFMDGGSLTNDGTGNAGNGGTIDFYGNLAIDIFDVYGGYCDTTNPDSRAGNGGSVYIDGSASFRDDVDMRGGNRDGALTGPSTGVFGGQGGYLRVWGDVDGRGDWDDELWAIRLHGGSCFTTNFGSHRGGSGGTFYVAGDASVSNLYIYGGQGSLADPFGFSGGQGGSVQVGGDLNCESMEIYGGDATTTGSAGNGGILEALGNVTAASIETGGGDAAQGNGGEGGNVQIEGATTITSNGIDSRGGSCASSDETHYAANGGSITLGSLLGRDGITITSDGGNRSGSTTVASTVISPNAGNITIRGPAVFGTVRANGGNITTDYPGPMGGSGGNITFHGTVTSDIEISSVGGSAAGNSGGNGGVIVFNGHASAVVVNTSGGDANNSILGGDAGMNGAAGNIQVLGGGAFTALGGLDGAGAGSAPVSLTTFELAGSITVGILAATDRAGVTIKPYTSSPRPCILKIEGMPNKNTLNDTAGNASPALGASTAGSIFFSGVGGTSPDTGWYALAGMDLFGGP